MPAPPPLIALSGDRDRTSGCWRPRSAYLEAVTRSGGHPFAIQRVEELARATGLVLTGGGDVEPRRYGGEVHPRLGVVAPERDEFELALVAEALERNIPLLGICRGAQVLVVACGGTLWQDLPSEMPGGLDHGRGAAQTGASARATHAVSLDTSSMVAAALGGLDFEVNSSHHQAAREVAAPLRVTGRAPDGVVEAVEAPGARFVLGVQWHPEDLLDRPEQARLLASFIAAARAQVG